MRFILGFLFVAVLKLVAAQQNAFDFSGFNFPNPVEESSNNPPPAQNSLNQMGNTGFNAQMPPVQGPPLTGVQFSGQATNPASNTLTGSVSAQQQPVNSFAQSTTGFGQGAVPGSNLGQIQPTNTLTGAAQKLTPEQQWLTVGGSRMPQNTNPTVNGNLNNGVPFNRLGFNPNDPTQFQPMNRNQMNTQFRNGQFSNQAVGQNQPFGQNRAFGQNTAFGQNQGFPQQGFRRQGSQNRGFTNQFENFGTSGNDMMSFNVNAMGPMPSDFSAFGGPAPNTPEGGPMGGMFDGPGGMFNGPGAMFGGPPGGFMGQGGFDSMGLPPFVRRSMGMGLMAATGPFDGGFQAGPTSFIGPFGKK